MALQRMVLSPNVSHPARPRRGEPLRSRPYGIKQVAPVVAIESDRLVVVTVYAFCIGERR